MKKWTRILTLVSVVLLLATSLAAYPEHSGYAETKWLPPGQKDVYGN
jgi:hypothetical protein